MGSSGRGDRSGRTLQGALVRETKEEKGLDVASLAPPAIKPGENRARVLAAAAALTVPESNAGGTELLQAPFGGLLAKDPVRLQIFLKPAVADNRVALQVLDDAESRPKSNWEITYRDGGRMRMPSLMEIRSLGLVNVAAGMLELSDGRADEANRRVRLGLVLAGSLTQEPITIVQLVRFAVARDQCRLLRDVLSQGEPSALALQALAVPLEDEAQKAAAVTGLIGELKYQSSLFDGIESGGQSLSDRGVAPSTAEAWLLWCLRPGARVVHARVLEQLHQIIEYARLQPFERPASSLRLPSDEPPPWWWRSLNRLSAAGLGRAVNQLSTAGLGRFVQSGDEHRALTMIAATAVALRRCRLDRGSYPTSLDELVPAFLPRVPVDPYTGRAPQYKRAGDGFELRVKPPEKTAAATVLLLDWRIAR